MTGAGMGPSSRVRLGIVGLGSVFEPYATLIRELRYEGRIEVVSTCDVVASRARRVQDFLHQEAPFTTDYADVVGRDDVDAVLVLTAMPSHGEIAAAALDVGKHVLVEKPMSVHVSEAAELVSKAAASPGLLVSAPMWCSAPPTRCCSTSATPALRWSPPDSPCMSTARRRGGKTGHDYRIRRRDD